VQQANLLLPLSLDPFLVSYSQVQHVFHWYDCAAWCQRHWLMIWSIKKMSSHAQVLDRQ
jgi:hypothetical protein